MTRPCGGRQCLCVMCVCLLSLSRSHARASTRHGIVHIIFMSPLPKSSQSLITEKEKSLGSLKPVMRCRCALHLRFSTGPTRPSSGALAIQPLLIQVLCPLLLKKTHMDRSGSLGYLFFDCRSGPTAMCRAGFAIEVLLA